MATTFYFNDSLNDNEISPSVDGDWSGGQTVSNFERHEMSTTRAGDAHFVLDTTESGSLQNCCQVQYVSPPIQAQTISGTISIGIMQRVSATGATHFAYHARVVTPAGATRGQLVDGTENVNTINSSVNFTQQFEGSVAISSVVCSDGDYIVVEIGYEINNTTSKTMETRIGTPTSNLSDTDGSTTSASGFITFSDDILFMSDLPSGTSRLMLMGVG